MSEIYIPFVACDKCMPGETVVVQNGTVLNDNVTTGYCVGFGIEQLLQEGWEERDYGHVCPACARIEKEEADRDAAEGAVVEHGAVAGFVTASAAALEASEQEYKNRKEQKNG